MFDLIEGIEWDAQYTTREHNERADCLSHLVIYAQRDAVFSDLKDVVRVLGH